MEYRAPELEVIAFEEEDIITTSQGNDLEYGGDI